MKNLIITGASRGIGRALALQFLEDRDIHVIALSRSEASLQSLAEEANHKPGRLSIQAFDLIKSELAPIGELVRQAGGELHLLINNAGLLIKKPFTETTDTDLQALWHTNVLGPARLARYCHPFMAGQAHPAHVLNIGSMGGFQGSSKFPGLAGYSATKAALASLTECLAEEWKDDHIRVNCLALGAVKTEMLQEAFPGYDPGMSSQQMAQFIKDFAESGHVFFNGKVLPVSSSTP